MKYAKLLVLKGFVNVVLLTGGIMDFGSKCGELIEGEQVPEFEPPKEVKSKKVLTRFEPYKKRKKHSKLHVSELPKKEKLKQKALSEKQIQVQTVSNNSIKKQGKFPANPTHYQILDDLKGQEVKPVLDFKKKPVTEKIK